MAEPTFSNKMSEWLKSGGSKTFGDLERVFEEKSFAVMFLFLMLPAALPIPTGGLTHIFAVINILVAGQLIFGRRSIWLPERWRQMKIGKTIETKALPKVINFIDWFERRSKPRYGFFLKQDWVLRAIGLIVLVLSIGVALSPPFSWLDTLPAMGAVLVAMSLILEDGLLFVVATAIGTAGIFVEVSLGSVALKYLI